MSFAKSKGRADAWYSLIGDNAVSCIGLKIKLSMRKQERRTKKKIPIMPLMHRVIEDSPLQND